jgi:hypothetical protein
MAQSAVGRRQQRKKKWHIAAPLRRLLPTRLAANNVMRSVIAQWECRYL